MDNEPSKESADAEQRTRDAKYAPRPLLAAAGFVLMFLLHAVRHDRLPGGSNVTSMVIGNGIAAIVAFLLFAPLMRMMRKLSWRAALLYSATICVGMFLGDVAYALLFMR